MTFEEFAGPRPDQLDAVLRWSHDKRCWDTAQKIAFERVVQELLRAAETVELRGHPHAAFILMSEANAIRGFQSE